MQQNWKKELLQWRVPELRCGSWDAAVVRADDALAAGAEEEDDGAMIFDATAAVAAVYE